MSTTAPSSGSKPDISQRPALVPVAPMKNVRSARVSLPARSRAVAATMRPPAAVTVVAGDVVSVDGRLVVEPSGG